MMTHFKTIKTHIAEQRFSDAIIILQKVAQETDNYNELIKIAAFIDEIPAKEFVKNNYLVKRMAILTGYTSHFITQTLKALLLRSHIKLETWESEFGLFEQAIYSKNEELKKFSPRLCYFCIGTHHLNFQNTSQEAERWLRLYQEAHNFLQCDIITNTFARPVERVLGNFEIKNQHSKTIFVQKINLLLAEKAQSFLHFNDIEYINYLHGTKNIWDAQLFDSTKIPVHLDGLIAYTKNLASICLALWGKSKKCLALDLDNTLWGGVIGDDGLAGIKIGEDSQEGEAYKRFQKYILELKQRGVILAVCSKNNEQIAKEPFLKRTDMVLRLEDFSCFIANWENKDRNLLEIAQTLNIGLDSIVFVDDNPMEREIVRTSIPQVSVPELPENPADYVTVLDAHAYFEPIAITSEDLIKTKQYQANQVRAEAASNFKNYDDFLRTLEMKAIIQSFDVNNIPRITQLINKTNQFNLTSKRYSESEVMHFMNEPKDYLTRYIKLKDKFGDHGLISVFIGKRNGTVLTIDTWLMSCRVLKRGVEQLLFTNLIQEARNYGMHEIIGEYLPTAKNILVKDLLKDFGFAAKGDDGRIWSLALHKEPKFGKFFIENVLENNY